MPKLGELTKFLESVAPNQLAESWDNVGLLIGNHDAEVTHVMTCLTLTRDCAEEAIAKKAGLVVTHHPLPFRPLKSLTSETEYGRILLRLIENRVAVYSAHTAFDSASRGVNQLWAEGLGLSNIEPILPANDELPRVDSEFDVVDQLTTGSSVGGGRWGEFGEAITIAELVQRTTSLLKVSGLHLVGDSDRAIKRVAVACGAAGSFLEPALKLGCDAFLTGETNFHTCLQARDAGITMLLPGHFASERFALEALASLLQSRFPKVTAWASSDESDPLKWVVG